MIIEKLHDEVSIQSLSSQLRKFSVHKCSAFFKHHRAEILALSSFDLLNVCFEYGFAPALVPMIKLGKNPQAIKLILGNVFLYDDFYPVIPLSYDEEETILQLCKERPEYADFVDKYEQLLKTAYTNIS